MGFSVVLQPIKILETSYYSVQFPYLSPVLLVPSRETSRLYLSTDGRVLFPRNLCCWTPTLQDYSNSVSSVRRTNPVLHDSLLPTVSEPFTEVFKYRTWTRSVIHRTLNPVIRLES